MSKATCIIGLGSPFGADQFGWQTIECLRQNHALQTYQDTPVELISADRPGLNLLHLIRGKSHVILVDAVTNCDEPGEILRLDRQALLQTETSLSSHAIGVADALALGEKLSDLPERLVLFGLCVNPNVVEIELEWIQEMVKSVMHELSL